MEKLGGYGISKVIHIADEKLNAVYSKAYSKIIVSTALAIGADIIILSHNSTGRSIAPRIAVKFEAPLFAGVNMLPENNVVRKAVFSGKAFADLQMQEGKRY